MFSSKTEPQLALAPQGVARSQVLRALGGLPAPEREALALGLLGRKSFAEISRITGGTPEAVARVASRGLSLLSAELAPLIEGSIPPRLSLHSHTVRGARRQTRAPAPKASLR